MFLRVVFRITGCPFFNKRNHQAKHEKYLQSDQLFIQLFMDNVSVGDITALCKAEEENRKYVYFFKNLNLNKREENFSVASIR